MTSATAKQKRGAAGAQAPEGASKKVAKKLAKKDRKKAAKQHRAELRERLKETAERLKEQDAENAQSNGVRGKKADKDAIIVEYVEPDVPKELREVEQPPDAMDTDDAPPPPAPSEVSDIQAAFRRYLGGEDSSDEDGAPAAGADGPARDAAQDAPGASDGSDADDEGRGDKIGKRKRKELERMKIVELKRACARPDLVEIWDVTAQDPRLLVHLKGVRNTVPVPGHWSQKRKYLQGKRGIEKPPFQLPDYIEATGIGKVRDVYLDTDGGPGLKQRARQRMRPKMGGMGIDHAVLQAAFFRYMTKPKMTRYGELYYEGKEYDCKPEGLMPGVLSAELREALGMDPDDRTAPPPWLVNMQRYGPPPSYMDLEIPGLNAPLPVGAEWGYQPGGWGKAPVDETGAPLYGDVFGQGLVKEDWRVGVDMEAKFGVLEVLESEEESSEEEEEEEEEEEGGAEATEEELRAGTASVASTALPPGAVTPMSTVEVRKDSAAPTPMPPGQFGVVLEQREGRVDRGDIMGTTHTYVIPGKAEKARGRVEAIKAQMGAGAKDAQVSLDPDEIEGLSDEEMRRLLEERIAEERARAGAVREDFSALVAERAAQQQKKESARQAKKEKEKFKF
ncbi:unnamed protein product [Pedinophyceae sp. YPF-701]|nr:unnamed protein product [Pedinophyceae sp. YPF-701]